MAALGKQLGAGFRELHVGPAIVDDEQAVLDRAVKTGLVFRRRTPELVQERPVDLLDQKPIVHVELEAVGELDDLAGCNVRVGVRAG